MVSVEALGEFIEIGDAALAQQAAQPILDEVALVVLERETGDLAQKTL